MYGTYMLKPWRGFSVGLLCERNPEKAWTTSFDSLEENGLRVLSPIQTRHASDERHLEKTAAPQNLSFTANRL